MKTILLPTDFEKHSEIAMDFAIKIAMKTNAKIIVVHSFFITTMDINVPANVLEELYDEEKKSSDTQLMNYCLKITSYKGQNGLPLQAEFISDHNIAAFEISLLAEKRNVDLIVMGTEGDTSLLSLINSTTTEVLNKVKCPVLIVHESSRYKNFDKIIFAVENMQNDFGKIKNLMSIAKPYNAEIKVLHIEKYPENMEQTSSLRLNNENSEYTINAAKEEFSYPQIKSMNTCADDTIQKIDHILLQEDPGLVVLVHKSRGLLESFFHRSVLRYSLKSIKTPLLVIN